MKYLCLIYDDESKRGTMPKEQLDTMMGEYGAFTEGIRKSGQYVGGEPLQPTQTATTVRVLRVSDSSPSCWCTTRGARREPHRRAS